MTDRLSRVPKTIRRALPKDCKQPIYLDDEGKPGAEQLPYWRDLNEALLANVLRHRMRQDSLTREEFCRHGVSWVLFHMLAGRIALPLSMRLKAHDKHTGVGMPPGMTSEQYGQTKSGATREAIRLADFYLTRTMFYERYPHLAELRGDIIETEFRPKAEEALADGYKHPDLERAFAFDDGDPEQMVANILATNAARSDNKTVDFSDAGGPVLVPPV